MTKFEISRQEQSTILSALNYLWNSCSIQLNNNFKTTLDGKKLPLGDIEKNVLKKEMSLIYDLILKINQNKK